MFGPANEFPAPPQDACVVTVHVAPRQHAPGGATQLIIVHPPGWPNGTQLPEQKFAHDGEQTPLIVQHVPVATEIRHWSGYAAVHTDHPAQ